MRICSHALLAACALAGAVRAQNRSESCEAGTAGCSLILTAGFPAPVARALASAFEPTTLANGTRWRIESLAASQKREGSLLQAEAPDSSALGIAAFMRGGVSGGGVDTGAEGAALPADALVCPLFVAAVVPVVHMDRRRTARLTLTLPNLARLILGDFATWADLVANATEVGASADDTRAARAAAAAALGALAELPVRLVLREDACGETEVLTTALSRASPRFAAAIGPVGALPRAVVDGGSRVVWANSETEARDALEATVGGLGFLALRAPLGAAGYLTNTALRVPLLKRADGGAALVPSAASLDACSPPPFAAAGKEASFARARQALIRWPAGSAAERRGAYATDAAAVTDTSGCWPLSRAFGLVAKERAIESDRARCIDARGPALELAHWLLATADAAHLMASLGAAPSAAGAACAAAVFEMRSCVRNSTAELWLALARNDALALSALKGADARQWARKPYAHAARVRADRAATEHGWSARALRLALGAAVLACAACAAVAAMALPRALVLEQAKLAGMRRAGDKGVQVAHGTHEFARADDDDDGFGDSGGGGGERDESPGASRLSPRALSARFGPLVVADGAAFVI
jgi:ABC-type phosphate transport system substrate-binding protein